MWVIWTLTRSSFCVGYEKIMRILKGYYENPRFRVKDREGVSEFYTQGAGIRQGCPLSPYVFTMFI